MIAPLVGFLLGVAAGHGWQRLRQLRRHRRYAAPLTFIPLWRKRFHE